MTIVSPAHHRCQAHDYGHRDQEEKAERLLVSSDRSIKAALEPVKARPGPV
jgi:hypothetical protein